MKISMIPNWHKKQLKCHFCGETRSVKYEVDLPKELGKSETQKVCVCNKCVLQGILKEN